MSTPSANENYDWSGDVYQALKSRKVELICTVPGADIANNKTATVKIMEFMRSNTRHPFAIDGLIQHRFGRHA